MDIATKMIEITDKSDYIAHLACQSGKYEIISQFQDGRNGYAFKARHIPKGIDVFLKICDIDTENVEVFQEAKFLVAATADGDVDHLVVLHDAEMLGTDYVLMAMELVNGGNLLARVIDNSVGQADAISFVMDILLGVGKLHTGGLLHRDLKPANILLMVDNGKTFAKVGDFGSVKRILSPDGTVNSSRHSPVYVPPEGWTTPNAYDTRSDLYQVGLVLHELVNGPLPYDLASQMDKIGRKQMLSQGFTSLQEMDACDACLLVNECIARRAAAQKISMLSPPQPYQSKKLTKIIKKATAPDRSDRYGSAFEFRAILQGLDLPNWKRNPGGYEALGWRGKDWRVTEVNNSGISSNQVWKRLSPDKPYRKQGPPHPDFKAAFDLVEEHFD
jgi:serine/threonine protein kinase